MFSNCASNCLSQCVNGFDDPNCQACWNQAQCRAYKHCQVGGRPSCRDWKGDDIGASELCERECRIPVFERKSMFWAWLNEDEERQVTDVPYVQGGAPPKMNSFSGKWVPIEVITIEDNPWCATCTITFEHCGAGDCQSPAARACAKRCPCLGDMCQPDCESCLAFRSCVAKRCEMDEARPCDKTCIWKETDDMPDDYHPLQEPRMCPNLDYDSMDDKMGDSKDGKQMEDYYKRVCFETNSLNNEVGLCMPYFSHCDKCTSEKALRCMNTCRCGPDSGYIYPTSVLSSNSQCTGSHCEGCSEFRSCMLPCEGNTYGWCLNNCVDCRGDCPKVCELKCSPYSHCVSEGGAACWSPGRAICELYCPENPAIEYPGFHGCDNCDMYTHCPGTCDSNMAKECMTTCRCGPNKPSYVDDDSEVVWGKNPYCVGEACMKCRYTRSCMSCMLFVI